MNYTHLFDIQWDDSYDDPDYGVPGTFGEWISKREGDRVRLAEQLEWMAKRMREGKPPFQSTPTPPIVGKP